MTGVQLDITVSSQMSTMMLTSSGGSVTLASTNLDDPVSYTHLPLRRDRLRVSVRYRRDEDLPDGLCSCCSGGLCDEGTAGVGYFRYL